VDSDVFWVELVEETRTKIHCLGLVFRPVKNTTARPIIGLSVSCCCTVRLLLPLAAFAVVDLLVIFSDSLVHVFSNTTHVFS